MRHFNASPERLFDAWLDVKEAGKWLFATPAGTMVKVEIDPRIGGTFTIIERREGEDIAHTGEYLEIDRPQRLVFSFAVPKFSADSTRVRIDVAASRKGCALTLTHEGVLPDYAERTKQGWATILDGLARVLGE